MSHGCLFLNRWFGSLECFFIFWSTFPYYFVLYLIVFNPWCCSLALVNREVVHLSVAMRTLAWRGNCRVVDTLVSASVDSCSCTVYTTLITVFQLFLVQYYVVVYLEFIIEVNVHKYWGLWVHVFWKIVVTEPLNLTKPFLWILL